MKEQYELSFLGTLIIEGEKVNSGLRINVY